MVPVMLISQIAKQTNVTKDAIRHYVNLGLLRPTPRRAGSRVYKDFSEQDSERLKWIIMGKSLGFTLSEIEHYLTMFMDNNLSREDAAEMFRAKLSEVEDRINQLQTIKARLTEKLETTYSE